MLINLYGWVVTANGWRFYFSHIGDLGWSIFFLISYEFIDSTWWLIDFNGSVVLLSGDFNGRNGVSVFSTTVFLFGGSSVSTKLLFHLLRFSGIGLSTVFLSV